MKGLAISREQMRTALDEECDRLARSHPIAASADLTPVYWLICELVDELDAGDGIIGEQLQTLVSRRVLDHVFVGETGDTVIDAHYRMPIDLEVRLITGVIGHLLEAMDHAPAGSAV